MALGIGIGATGTSTHFSILGTGFTLTGDMDAEIRGTLELCLTVV